MLAIVKETYHLFKNTNTTVLAIFRRIQAPSTILLRSPFFGGGGGFLLAGGSSSKSLALPISMSSSDSSKDDIPNNRRNGIQKRQWKRGVSRAVEADKPTIGGLGYRLWSVSYTIGSIKQELR